MLLAVLMLAAQGCSRAPRAEHTFVVLAAPTVEPVVTPVPTPEPTPTPKATKKPEATKKPRTTKASKETAKPKDEESSSKKPSGKTPYANDYTTVDMKFISQKGKEFSAVTSDGSTITQAYFANGAITLVNFWSTT